MSDTSSVSLELGPGSRDTSAATLSPGLSSRAWDEGDTRSEHSYSESGASGSSFEELDLEGEGALGEPRFSPETEPLGAGFGFCRGSQCPRGDCPPAPRLPQAQAPAPGTQPRLQRHSCPQTPGRTLLWP